ncbi:hypothetical protein [Natronorubrum sp. FCH18a]|uniref:hypothetical protein n=1 Tax=Natronorubrum sp. FCH18a TaxID=3447018 RepID=UPI003F511850
MSDARNRIRAAVGGSAILQLGVDWFSRLRARAADESAGGIRLERARTNSRLIALIAGSTLVAGGLTIGTRIGRWWEDSRLVDFGTKGRDVLESSFAYQWLTSEPDPEVIVIDLRETRAVGPVIRAVDRVGSELEARSTTSTVVSCVRRFVSVVRARPIRAVSAVVLSAVIASLALVVSRGLASEPILLAQLLVAGLATLGLRSRSSLKELLETRVGRVLVAAFEPPEPPEGVESESRQDGEDTR